MVPLAVTLAACIVAPGTPLSAAPASSLTAALELVEAKHTAANARAGQRFHTWTPEGATAPEAPAAPVSATARPFRGAEGAPPLFKGAPCCAVTDAPLFSADECAWIVDEAEKAGRWVPQEFRYAKDVVQQVEDLPEVRAWVEDACREQIFPLLQRTFPAVVGAGAAARDALRVFDAKILKYDASKGQSYLGTHRDGTLLTAVTALNSLDEYRGGGTYMEPLGETVRYDVGHVCCHAGEVRHAGARIESGVRYALVTFIDSASVFEPARALANEGDAQRLRGELDEASRLYDLSLEAGHWSELPWCGMGQVALERGRFSEAAACYAEAVDACPDHAVAWTNLGVALAKVGKGDVQLLREAASALETAASLDDAEPAPLNNLGLLLGDLSIHDAAAEAFTKAIARATANAVPARELADLYNNLGVELVAQEQLSEGLRAFSQAIEADPSHPGAANNVVAMKSSLSGKA